MMDAVGWGVGIEVVVRWTHLDRAQEITTLIDHFGGGSQLCAAERRCQPACLCIIKSNNEKSNELN